MTLDGRTKRSVKARRSTDCITARGGRKSETRSQKTSAKGAKGKDVERRLEVAKRNHVAPTERRQLEDKPLVDPQVGVGKAQKLGNISKRLSRPRHHRWLSVGSFGQVRCTWMVSGAA